MSAVSGQQKGHRRGGIFSVSQPFTLIARKPIRFKELQHAQTFASIFREPLVLARRLK